MAPSDADFAAELDAAVVRYLRAVDAWEMEFKKPAPSMEAVLRDYVQARHQLERRVPRARILCARHGVRDPFPSLMRVALGGAAPAVGRNERAAIHQSLVELAAAIEGPESAPRTFLDRIRDFF